MLVKSIVIILIIVAACLAWVVWTTVRERKQADESSLNKAWRKALDDPHYVERRQFEERKRVVDQARHAAAVH